MPEAPTKMRFECRSETCKMPDAQTRDQAEGYAALSRNPQGRVEWEAQFVDGKPVESLVCPQCQSDEVTANPT